MASGVVIFMCMHAHVYTLGIAAACVLYMQFIYYSAPSPAIPIAVFYSCIKTKPASNHITRWLT